ncbi:Protein of unknown function [Thermobacillus xylanilyticus]|uniref:Uncharacterized protein n=1 Tax=Thermobacillus xylanilyticus TaxID=76633 RepID=A0ABN7RLV3_THEXY|nr:Protein of unknown function [Thermobacillus xylanilyticus]
MDPECHSIPCESS